MFEFNILKNFIQKINTIRNKKKLLDSLKIGDLVWAKMPFSKKKLNLIEEVTLSKWNRFSSWEK